MILAELEGYDPPLQKILLKPYHQQRKCQHHYVYFGGPDRPSGWRMICVHCGLQAR